MYVLHFIIIHDFVSRDAALAALYSFQHITAIVMTSPDTVLCL